MTTASDICEDRFLSLFCRLRAITRQGPQVESIRQAVNRFAVCHGRRPRLLVSHVGRHGRKRHLNQLAAIFAQWGFDVDIGSLRHSASQAASMAIENDVHLVYCLCDHDRDHAAALELAGALASQNGTDILVAVADAAVALGDGLIPTGMAGLTAFKPETAADVLALLAELSQKQ